MGRMGKRSEHMVFGDRIRDFYFHIESNAIVFMIKDRSLQYIDGIRIIFDKKDATAGKERNF